MPLPTSFPPFFLEDAPLLTPEQKIDRRPKTSTSALSMLLTTPSTCSLFAAYATFADVALIRHGDIFERMGLDRDDIKGLRDDLRVLEDAYKENREDGIDGESALGEDEEY